MSDVVVLERPPRPTVLKSLLDLDQAVLDALPMGVYACDAQGRIVRVNRRACELWGRTPGLNDPEQLFCGSFRVESLVGEFLPPEGTPMARAVRHGESFEGAQARVVNPDGRRWVASVTIEPLRDDAGQIVGAINCFQDVSRDHEIQQEIADERRMRDLAIAAAEMGAWRYTMADNICLYDARAQQLYGLTDGRFLHDEEGVKGKFHPDDMELMWRRVGEAIDPAGDGRYNVEYRVKQLDGSWKWLSAWGIVEFEGEGQDRKPVAIVGASRDLTDLKSAEELQRLLINELNHRVKNTLATVQSIAHQTLRSASDVETGRRAIEDRIASLARAHDLLTHQNWSGADLDEVVRRALEPFALDRVTVRGTKLRVSPKHALALSLALHELATNASKYGAFSEPEGRVELGWVLAGDALTLEWREAGGPPVTPPTRRGFGSRLLETGLARELGGRTRLDFAPEGLACEMVVGLEAWGEPA